MYKMHDLADAHLISFAFFAAAHEGRLVTRGGLFAQFVPLTELEILRQGGREWGGENSPSR